MQKVNYHSHTHRCMHSDIDMLDEEYVKTYIEKGFKEIAFTDHCPQKEVIDNRPKVRMRYDQKEEYLESILQLKEKYKNQIKIKSGYEVEYLPGQEENILELKAETDVLVLGQHFVYGNNNELRIFGKCEYTAEELKKYAKYVERALELGIPDIIAHPDIYLSKREKFEEIETEVAHDICKAAQKYKIPLELNLNNIFQRTYNENRILNNDSMDRQLERLKTVQYPRREFWEIVAEYEIDVLYGIDTHYRGQIEKWDELIELATVLVGKETIDKLNFIEKI